MGPIMPKIGLCQDLWSFLAILAPRVADAPSATTRQAIPAVVANRSADG